ncbi:MAG: ABC transporter ATP-binding protein [Candidatus Cyclobacteriaceae bacterium M3_2C_046]
MAAETKSGNVVDLEVLKQLFQYVKPYIGKFYVLVALTFVVAILAPATPVIIKITIDQFVAEGDYQGLVMMITLLISLLVVQSIAQYFHTFLSDWLGQNIIKDLRIKLYRHLLRLKLKFYDNTPIGKLVTRNISDIETLAEVFSQGVAAIVADLLQIVVILSIMFYLSWELTLISLSTLPLLLISTYIFKEKIKVAFNLVRNAVANLNSFVQEHITGMSIVQIFNSEEREYNKFKDINQEHKAANIKSVLYYSIYFPVAEVIQALGIGLVVWYGAREIIQANPNVTIGVLIAFIMYISMFFRPIRMIADRFNTLQLGIVSSSRIFSLLESQDYIPNQGTIVPKEIKGQVEFKKVWFAYIDQDYVLKDISFEVKAGQTVALVGATGAGKSSVINLLNRFYDINKGEIKVDGVNIREYELVALREKIGVVLQDVFLFSDTIEQNITLGNQDIDRDRIMYAAELVGAKSFIERLPGGLEYNVMERGATLSVGQRQLISFVRAMVYDPKIIVLDEATSSVDTETEELIQHAIEKLMKDRTSIVIAHRLSTIQKADNILVLDKGEIKERGNHEQLLALNGYYTQLHKMQYKEVV